MKMSLSFCAKNHCAVRQCVRRARVASLHFLPGLTRFGGGREGGREAALSARTAAAAASHESGRQTVSRLDLQKGKYFSTQKVRLLADELHTEPGIRACTWLREISSCSCFTVLPGPAWVLLSKTNKPLFLPLYLSTLTCTESL